MVAIQGISLLESLWLHPLSCLGKGMGKPMEEGWFSWSEHASSAKKRQVPVSFCGESSYVRLAKRSFHPRPFLTITMRRLCNA